MPRVAIALGSNLGDRSTNIAAAIAELKAIATPGEPFLTASLHDTDPQNCPPDSPRFLNTAIEFHYADENPLALLDLTQDIEKKLGREPKPIRNAPRIIDIDILLFGETELDHPRLTLPHPRIRERPFVLLPLREILPNFC
ncbi:MAG: 2-amino-4-hydroxy-6-hydroxymethyldihydropteridine diphosphokinase [Akkermansiaceae bacterium]|nr:2-amino-4-hydroxy-6-hydroxymethyldihydropteridine diphosphokinase [Akkermansiaceae bacterium]MDP4646379.1 2-amino-4-hydroxy-6-hydroxymethyldihydropteridine diphosphokinase [Akkermansiaceae bacterium]MDP4721930.1 2-amino-4-hydroxy-6-hydroxymethyldihydropteridine diphosphokinase [Akkermansiaceae bacterium]MDP4779982.1 2-amino-4-hydroxy-6-hydroxymethyldihydropteridine diphosphokinase [Akkermansiaceae bacterium]MDP4847092.1 2-amino-4-hydroxy-6-hydroxymethyldihydropteridine diphosphokinase [Akker